MLRYWYFLPLLSITVHLSFCKLFLFVITILFSIMFYFYFLCLSACTRIGKRNITKIEKIYYKLTLNLYFGKRVENLLLIHCRLMTECPGPGRSVNQWYQWWPNDWKETVTKIYFQNFGWKIMNECL